MAGEQTISEAIGSDHKEIDRYAEELKSAKTLEDQVKWRNAFVWRLARHAISEELTMYPAMVEKLGDEGKELTDTDRAQHAAVSSSSTSFMKKRF
jgi:hemerythrin superfamily protein